MKKKLASFRWMRGRISATLFDQLSTFHWMPFGEQALPVRSEDEAESKMTRRLRAFASSWIASATPELVMSKIARTPRSSYHWRAIAKPTSTLFPGSGTPSSLGLPLPAPPQFPIPLGPTFLPPPPQRFAHVPDPVV